MTKFLIVGLFFVSTAVHADPCSKIREDLNGTHFLQDGGCTERVVIDIHEGCREIKFSSHLLKSSTCEYEEQIQDSQAEKEYFQLGKGEFEISNGMLVELKSYRSYSTLYYYRNSSGSFQRKSDD